MCSKEKWQVTASILFIVLVIVVFQYQSLGLDMYYDDFGVIKSYNSQELKEIFYKNLSENYPSWLPAWRPIIPLMYHVAYEVCGFDPFNLHMMIILLQIVQTVIAFILIRMLTQRDSLALASSLLFSLNPNLFMHFTWASEIGAVTGMIPFLLSLIALVSYINNPKPMMILIHCFFAILAYLTKETFSTVFLLTILTILFYRKHAYKQYFSLVGCHMFIFISYLTARTLILRGFGGQGISPDNYSGIDVYFLNYSNFLSKISLFTHYISSGPWRFLLYILIVCIFSIALKKVLESYVGLSRKFLFFILTSYLFLLYRLLPYLSNMQAIPQLRGGRYEGFLFVYAMGLFIIMTLFGVSRKKKLNLDEKPANPSSSLQIKSNDPFNKLSVLSQKETLVKFFSYSFLFLLISGLPMFFFPEGRIMNVTALAMGAVFASSFFIVLSMIGESSQKRVYIFSQDKTLTYTLCFLLIFFILNNGFIFKEEYIGPQSPYSQPNRLKSNIENYIVLYPYFQKYNMTEQGAYLFNSLVSEGVVDKRSGKLIMEKVIDRFPTFVRRSCLSENAIYDFQPYDANIYPITK